MKPRKKAVKCGVLVPVAAFVVMLVVAVGATGAAGRSYSAASRCDGRSGSTLLETGKVRIYALPEEPTARPAHRQPVIGGRPIFGCLEQTGRSLMLDLPEVGNGTRAFMVEVGSQALATKGPLVAYSYTEYYLDTHETWVRVRNLRTGAVIRTCRVGGGRAPNPQPRVTSIVLNSNGEVGWHAKGEDPRLSEEPAPGCFPGT
jgi:hypothetical protein